MVYLLTQFMKSDLEGLSESTGTRIKDQNEMKKFRTQKQFGMKPHIYISIPVRAQGELCKLKSGIKHNLRLKISQAINVKKENAKITEKHSINT